MFRDNSLVPAEALRLAALGMLAEAPRRYGELSSEIRHFASRIAGPSIELMGTSVELLRYERLVEANAEGVGAEGASAEGVGAEGAGGDENPVLRLTPGGLELLQALLRAPLKAPGSQFNRLFLALKLRFLHLLPAADRAHQIELIADWYRSERARLEELRDHPSAIAPLFQTWLDQETAQIDARLRWLADAAHAVTES
jgi:hypothetical protein